MSTPLKNSEQFFRCLAFLYRSGYPLGQSFHLLTPGLESERDRITCQNLGLALRNGSSLSESFRKAGFGKTTVATIEAGQEAGKLEECLDWYATFEERTKKIKREMKQALLQPAITLFFSLFVALALPPLVLKEQLEILVQSGAEMPFISLLLYRFSCLLSHPVVLLLPLVVLGAGRVLMSQSATPESARKLERLLLLVPAVGNGLKRAAGARSLALLALLLRAGVPLLRSVELAAQGSGSLLLGDKLMEVRSALIEGRPFHRSMVETDWYLSSTLGLMSASEVSGDLGYLLELASSVEEERLRSALEALATLLQPLLLVFVGALVCLMIIAVLAPSLSLIQGL